jgi:hypothetical protein
MDLMKLAAEGWRMHSRKSCHASGVGEVSLAPSIITGAVEASGGTACGGRWKGEQRPARRLEGLRSSKGRCLVGGERHREGSRRRGRGPRSGGWEPQEKHEDDVEFRQREWVGKVCEWIGTTTKPSNDDGSLQNHSPALPFSVVDEPSDGYLFFADMDTLASELGRHL